MSSFAATELRLRAACPLAEASPPPLALVLRLIERAEAAPARAPRPHRRRWWRRTRVVAPAVAAAVVLAGAGGGALLLQQGKPVPAEYVLPANPETGLGQPDAASLAPLPMRVADPDGGPPWAMRVIHTTRGLVCLQGGRLLDGQLGGLGSGYAFHGDGRFHPFLAEDAIAADACPAVGGEGIAFLPGPPVIVPANGLPLAGENVAPDGQVHCDLPGQEDWGVRCPQPELRQVAMGLLGPDASSISVFSAGSSFTVKPSGPEGAYLIVMSAQPNANASMSSGSFEGPFGYVSNARGGAVLTVTYDDGSQCQIPFTGSGRQCRPHGAAGAGGSAPDVAIPSTSIHAGYLPTAGHLETPLLADARGGSPDSTRAFQPAAGGEQGSGPAVSVTFSAPVAAPNASTAYVVELQPREVAGCATPSVIVSQPSSRDIASGQQVQMTVPLESNCATSYSGRVFLARSSSVGGESGGEGPLYEVIAAQFGPGARGNPSRFPTVGRFRTSVP
ncbi:MAG TPA: hypothetical protein VLZ06_09835 [Solirubrobacteraceae bacterium]|nr:hypothetical protein [Solirubrobacteraceae bacterium]